ncbi:MAG TPA: glycosyltransferase family 2 protein [Candidatus Sulfotelmatobacter sp.]|nr:glycosyltransferase family 2 protein [Candidatus Sulfotelmatobacter sp.]
MSATRQRVALVAPFFGGDLRARKERFAYAFATHLALEGMDLEVLTTTAREDAPDANFFTAGVDRTEPFPVLRFRVNAPDRVAYEEAVLAARNGGERRAALLDERLRSPDLRAHVRAAAARYDAFLFVDVSVPTTVHALPDVAERAILVPLLDDAPAARLPDVVETVARSRMILCTTEAEAALIGELFGSLARARTRVLGLGVDRVPLEELHAQRVRRVTRGEPYVLVTGDDVAAHGEIVAGGAFAVALDAVEERDRPAFFAAARAVAVTGTGRGFVPEVAEAWAYGKAVLAAEDAPGAAALVRETGGGIVVPPGGWTAAVSALPLDDALALLARRGAAYLEATGDWRRIAARTAEAVDALAALEDDRSRAALVAQVAYLYPLVQRQRRTIEAMRASRFWRLRDGWFATKRRLGIGPTVDPVARPQGEDRGAELAALGDPYQLFRENHRLRREDVERMRRMVRFLPRQTRFGLVIDARDGGSALPVVRSLREQVYPHWIARVQVAEQPDVGELEELQALAAEDPRIVLVAPGGERFGDADVLGGLHGKDRLEPHALFEFALALQDEVDVVYCDEDRLDERGVPRDPWFKPDWSPETLLTRDYVGALCVVRHELLEKVGGVRDVFETAAWYDALLRATEASDRVVHVPQVLVHRGPGSLVAPADQKIAVESALRRRGETAALTPAEGGLEVRFATAGERVCVVIPTRDRADLLGPCIASVFERTAYPNFEVVVIDNGSREEATLALLARWERERPGRFRVLRDAAPFNYSRLNNEAIGTTAAPFVLLLNNDTEVLSPEWMEAMLGQARRAAIGAVGAYLLYEDETVQHAGVVLGILGLAGHAHRFLPAGAPGYHGGLRFDTNYLAVTGACLMIERRKYWEVGGLDEALAVSYNDVDLCLKLRRAGYRNVFVPAARLHHYESKSRGTDDTLAKVARAMEEVEAIRRRWPQWAAHDPYYNPNLTVDAEDFGLRL